SSSIRWRLWPGRDLSGSSNGTARRSGRSSTTWTGRSSGGRRRGSFTRSSTCSVRWLSGMGMNGVPDSQPELEPYAPDDHELRSILSRTGTIAVVGLSSKPHRPSYDVASYLQTTGYRIIPVNPHETDVLGEQAYPSLLDVPHV